jgi:hypothetical protein
MSPVQVGPEAVDQFVARVLRRAHETAEARDAPSEARAILHVARLFADELTAGDPGFDRAGFVTAVTTLGARLGPPTDAPGAFLGDRRPRQQQEGTS